MGVFLSDLDGCLTAPAGAGRRPAPCEGMEDLLLRLRNRGHILAVATGASQESVEQLAAHLPRVHHFDVQMPSYCARAIAINGHTEVISLLSPNDRLALDCVAAHLDQIARDCKGLVADTGDCYTMFFSADDQFDTAAGCSRTVCQVYRRLRLRANRHDKGITVAPMSAQKLNAVRFMQERFGEIYVSAGDTESDRPMLEAARFPILTRTCPGSPLDSGLESLVRERGGYVAGPDEPHSIGLLRGLEAAEAAGII